MIDLHLSPDIIRVIKSRIIRWEDNVARMGDRRSEDGALEEKYERERQLRRPGCRWEKCVKPDLE